MPSQPVLQSLMAWDTLALVKAVAGVFAVAAFFFVVSRRRSSLPLPPGPPPKPLVGNLFDLPPTDGAPWLKWSEWTQTYGEQLLSSCKHAFR